MIKIKRAYETTERQDGYRVLVDRLWPRGVRKSDLVLDDWIREIAPSTELRKSFAHDPEKWSEFQRRYKAELRAKASREKLAKLAKRAARGTVTLVYSAKDTEHNNAVVLKKLLDRELKRSA